MLVALREIFLLLLSVLAAVTIAACVLVIINNALAIYTSLRLFLVVRKAVITGNNLISSATAARTPTKDNCPQCGQPKEFPGMKCYGNENSFHRQEFSQ